MQIRGECDQWPEVAVVGSLQGVDVVVAVMARHDDGQVVVLHQVPGDEGARDAAVAVRERVYLREAVMQPGGDQQWVVFIGLLHVFVVPGEQVVELGEHVLGRAVLVEHAVGAGGVVGHRLEGTGVKTRFERLPLGRVGPVGGLVSDDYLVELADGREADGAVVATWS